MILTDADKAHAKELGLTQEEFRIALAAHIPPARWAERKREIAKEYEAGRARDEAFGAAVTNHLKYAVRRCGGTRDESSSEDGDAPA